MSDYSKFKERRPEDTIFYIHTLLNQMHLFTTVDWIEKPYEGVRSNRVTIYPTNLGQNGKGTDEVYTLASGYAELMERIQNNLLALRQRQPALAGCGGFELQPDEKIMTVEEVLSQKDPYLSRIFTGLGLFSEEGQRAYLLETARVHYGREDGKIPAVPFADLKGRKVVYIPYFCVLSFNGSNGMAAGNTIEEALVQGISEIFERYVNRLLLRGECVPPRIPEEALQAESIRNLIEQIRADGRYDVQVLDCSLGRGLPVCATLIIDRERGTFSMKLGSHPSFAVSVERTLTETFQGKGILSATGLSRLGSLRESTSHHNIPNVAKVGYGVYPYRMLTEDPQWEFKPWTEWEGLDNRGFLKKMLALLEEMGFSLLVRDASHLGFSSCFAVVPGMSEMYPVTPLTQRSLNSNDKSAAAFSHFPDLTEAEEEGLLTLISFKEGSVLENTFSGLFQRPISGKKFTLERVGAFLALKKKNYSLSLHFFQKLLAMEEEEEEKEYLRCLIDYVRALQNDLDRPHAERMLRLLYREKAAERVLEETKDPAEMMGKIFPRVSCYNCEACPLAGRECLNPEEVRIFRSIREAMKDSKVSQEKLLRELLALRGE